MRIGEKIQRIRKERGYTAEQLAEMLGISAVSLRKYEYGERTPKDPMVAEVARCLEVNTSPLSNPTGEATPTMRYTCCSSWRRRSASSPSRLGKPSCWPFQKTWAARIRKLWQRRFATGIGATET